MKEPLKVVQLGNKVIRSKAKKVSDVCDPKVKRIIDDLVVSMREQNLVGMAAPQIEEGVRIFVTEVRPTTYRKNIAEPDELRVFINPEIVSRSKKKVAAYEGCGSVAEATLFGPVSRSGKITVRALDADGKSFTFEASGFLARIIQHETDHLDGIVFLDKVTDTRKLMGRQEYIDSQKKNL